MFVIIPCRYMKGLVQCYMIIPYRYMKGHVQCYVIIPCRYMKGLVQCYEDGVMQHCGQDAANYETEYNMRLYEDLAHHIGCDLSSLAPHPSISPGGTTLLPGGIYGPGRFMLFISIPHGWAYQVASCMSFTTVVYGSVEL